MADFQGQVKQGVDAAADKAKQAVSQSGASGQTKTQAGDLIGQARDGVSSVVEQASKYVGGLNTGDLADDATRMAKQAGDRVQHWAQDAYESVSGGDFGAEVTSLIRKHPVPALLIGFGVGLLLGRAAKA